MIQIKKINELTLLAHWADNLLTEVLLLLLGGFDNLESAALTVDNLCEGLTNTLVLNGSGALLSTTGHGLVTAGIVTLGLKVSDSIPITLLSSLHVLIVWTELPLEGLLGHPSHLLLVLLLLASILCGITLLALSLLPLLLLSLSASVSLLSLLQQSKEILAGNTGGLAKGLNLLQVLFGSVVQFKELLLSNVLHYIL